MTFQGHENASIEHSTSNESIFSVSQTYKTTVSSFFSAEYFQETETMNSYWTSVHSEITTEGTEDVQFRFPVSKIDQKRLIEQWRIYPSSRPPVNELYLTDISDNLLFNFGLPN